MNASVYQGESRALPRWTLVAMLMVVSLVLTGTLLFESPGVHSIRNPPWVLRPPFAFRPLAAALGLFAIYGLIQVGRRRSPLAWGLGALLALSYLKESQWALTGYEIRDVFICGAVFLGWLFGVFFSRTLDDRLGRPRDDARDDALGEAGATGAFVAVYLGAFVSKLIESGLSWADGANLLSSIVSRHKFTSAGGLLDSYLGFLVAHPAVATAFAATTLSIQGGMFLYLISPRLRMIWGTLVICFHVNAFLLMGVRYIEPIIFSLVLSYPWPRIVRRLRGQPSVPPTAALLPVPEPGNEKDVSALKWAARRAVKTVAATGAIALVLWFGIHWNDTKHLFLDQGFWKSSGGNSSTNGTNGTSGTNGTNGPNETHPTNETGRVSQPPTLPAHP